MSNFNCQCKVELFWDLLTRFFFILICFLFREATFGVSHCSHHLCHLDFNLIFHFFRSRPSDFKSGFKLRKGHFPTVEFSEILLSPTESHSPGMKQSHARTSGPIGKSFMNPRISWSHLSQAYKFTGLEKAASLSVDICNFNFFKINFYWSIVAIVFPVVMYTCEDWTIKRVEHWRIDAFHLGVAGEDCWESLGQYGGQTSQS